MKVKRKEISNIKIKRILLFYGELERLKVSHEGSLQIMEYIFSVSQKWIEEILRKNDIKKFSSIKLQHEDIDMIIIDAYVKKMHKEAQKQRKIK